MTVEKILCWEVRKVIPVQRCAAIKADLFPFEGTKESAVLIFAQSNVVVPLKNLR